MIIETFPTLLKILFKRMEELEIYGKLEMILKITYLN